MISKKYSLREVFEKGLLISGEYVNIEGLYTPYKKIPRLDRWKDISVLSLNSYFGEDRLKQTAITKKSDGTIVVELYRRNTESAVANLVASKLLSDDLYGITASCYSDYRDEFKENWNFKICLNPDIIVKFEGEEETPYLELPPHVAYTC